MRSLDNLWRYKDIDGEATLTDAFGPPELIAGHKVWKTPYKVTIVGHEKSPLFSYLYDNDLPFVSEQLDPTKPHNCHGVFGKEDIPNIIATFKADPNALAAKPSSVVQIESLTHFKAIRKPNQFGAWHITGVINESRFSMFNNPFNVSTGYTNSAYVYEVWWRDEADEPSSYIHIDDICADLLARKKCFVCGTPTVKSCAACRCQYYCSVSCQSKDWTRHKKNCGAGLDE